MADGDIILQTPGRRVVALIDASGTGSTTNGVWVSCGDYGIGTITVIGGTGTTQIEIDGLNDERASSTTSPPAAANNGVRITAAALTAGADAFVTLAALPTWIKARIVASGTGTVTAVLNARAFPL